MKNYLADYNLLFEFSKNLPYQYFSSEQLACLEQLNRLKEKYHFPALADDIGSFMAFYLAMLKPKRVFEMGSGYGHSSFWYQFAADNLEEVVLTEIREDLECEFKQVKFPDWYECKLKYYQQDAFEVIKNFKQIDFLLIDGEKATYTEFLEFAYDYLSDDALVMIDNSFWRGSFLDPAKQENRSALNIKKMHEKIKASKRYQAIFIPFQDGVTLLKKLPL